tara:strand:- start:746 stop:1528 length:783 start_codon:yes stop_codon:yes gene_type:complete
MEGISFIEHPFFNSEVCQSLFNLNFTIYGRFIRQAMTNTVPNDLRVINCFGRISLRSILEKTISKFTISHSVLTPLSLSYIRNTIVNYSINIEGKKYLLDVIYINDLQIDNFGYFERDLSCIINIDTLFIKNNTLGVISDKLSDTDDKFNLKEVLEDIKYKRFRIKNENISLKSKEISYLRSLLNIGYRNMNRKFSRYIHEYECKICYEDTFQPFSELECGHIFHTSCLQEAVKECLSKTQPTLFKCPYCQKKYINYEII